MPYQDKILVMQYVMLAADSKSDKVSLEIWQLKDKMNKALSGDRTQAELLQVLMAQWPGRISLTRSESAKTLGYKNAITVDRLRQRGLLHASVATRRPTYPLTEIARFLAETSEGI